jgi:hypothetical protein
MKYTRPKPIKKTPKQNPIPPAVCALDSPCTIILKNSPRKKPKRFPTAKRSPVAEPYPTGKASSHPSSSMIGTSGMRKNEL